MWVMTKDGFFSAVQKDSADGLLEVRARARGDLERLALTLPEFAGLEILDSELKGWQTDYRYRVLVDQEAWGRYLAKAAEEIDYPNFKQMIGRELGEARADVYADVWSVLLGLEGKSARLMAEPREPTDDEIYNRPGVEGGIGYPIGGDEPGSLGENDYRL